MPFRFQNSLRDPRPPGHCPLALGILGRGVGPLLPAAQTPGGRERRGGRPAQWCLQRKGERSADGKAKAAQELILAVVQEGAEGQCQGQGRQLLLQRGAHDPVTVHRACGSRGGKRLGGLMSQVTSEVGHTDTCCVTGQAATGAHSSPALGMVAAMHTQGSAAPTMGVGMLLWSQPRQSQAHHDSLHNELWPL